MTGAILLLALLLRLPLFTQSLWLDEAIQALALQGHYGNLWSYALSDFQPPLYHYLLQAWTLLVGTSEWALRTPSLLAGLLTVLYLYKIGKEFFSDRVGWIVGILSATNPLLIYYSQEGRTYALTTFLVTASMYYFFQIYRKTSNKLYTIYYFLFTALYLWTSYLSWFLWLAFAGYLFFARRTRLLWLHLAAAVPLLLWLPSFWRSLSIGLADASQIPGWGAVVGGTTIKALALTWVKFVLGRVSFESPWVYLSVIGLVGVCHFAVLRQLKSPHPLLSTWLGFGLALPALISLWVPAYSYTRVLFVLPAYLLLLSLGLAKERSRFLTSALVLIQLGGLIYYWVTPRFHKEDWRSLVTDLNTANAQLVMPSLKQDPPLRYYGLTLPVEDVSTLQLTQPLVYYLEYMPTVFDPHGVIVQSLESGGYTKVKEVSYPSLKLSLYENRP